MGQTLLGSYIIPATVDVPLELAVNPWGTEERSRKFVWNSGDNRRKLITLTNKADRQRQRGHLPPGGGIHEGAAWSDGKGRLVQEAQKGRALGSSFRDLGQSSLKSDSTKDLSTSLVTITIPHQTHSAAPYSPTKTCTWLAVMLRGIPSCRSLTRNSW